MATSEIITYSDHSLKILDAIEEAIYFADPDTYEVLYTNQKFKSIWGDPGETEGIKCFHFLQGMDRPCDFCTNEIIFNKKPGDVHIWEFRNNGNNRWYRCYDRAVEWTNGKMVRMEMAVDITAEKNAIAGLEEVEERYKLTESAANLGIWDWNVLSDKVYYSPVWKMQIGYQDDELPNSFDIWVAHLHPEDRERCLKTLQDYLDHPRGKFLLDFRFQHKQGHYIWIHNEANTVQDEQGQVVRFYGAHTDVTEQKLSEIKLRLSETKYRSVFESANDAYLIFNENGRIIDVNQAATASYGYSREELTGKLVSDLVHPDHHSKLSDLISKVRKNGAYLGETIEIRKDGSPFPAEVAGSLIMHDDKPHFLAAVKDVSDLRAREQDLMLKNLVFDNSIAANITTDRFWKISNVNKAFLKNWGYFEEENVVGRDFSELLLHEKDIFHIRKEIEKSASWQGTLTALKSDGTTFFGQVSASRISDANKEIHGYHLSVIDVTESETAEKKIRESEQRFQSLYHDAPDMYTSVSPQTGEIIECNRKLEEKTGYSKEEVIGQSVLHLFDDSTAKEAKSLLKQVQKTGEARDMKLRIRKKDQTVFDVSLNVTSLRDENGTIAQSMLSLRDITEVKLHEQELVREKLFTDSVLNAMPGIFYLFDENGKFLRWNNALAELSGLSNQDVAKKTPLDLIAKKDRNKVSKAIKNAFRTGEVYVEADFLSAGRENIPFYFTGIRVSLEGHTLLLGVGIDISRRKQTERKMENLAEELKRSNIELERFASIASHDLQEPLRMVASYTQLLEKRYKDKIDEKANRYINYAVDGAQRMQVLINDLLQYSRISTRGESFHQTDMNEVVSNAINNIESRITKSKAEINVEKLPVVNGDQAQLERLFLNFFSNALKFSQKDKIPKINISAKKAGSFLEFSVSDNGIGIDDRFKEKIFIIFQRLHTKEDFEGTGIGLAICKRIVERHGGKLWFTSEKGVGTTFKFTIPKIIS